jgi:2-keto-3-deoxy-L-rhamnonate aldolase RhmA
MGLRHDLDADALWDEVILGLSRIRSAGKAPGVLAMTEQRRAQCIEAGATFLGVASDAMLLQGALAQAART